MIDLHTYRASNGQPTATPFGVKALILLRMASVEHRIVYQDDPRKAPKGKLPLIVDQGEIIADSTFIRHHLEAKHGADFDAGLSESERAASLAFQRLAEESLYWSLVSARWVDDRNWPTLRDAIFSQIPKLVRPLIAGQIRKKLLHDLRGHGAGRHSLAEQYRIGADNLAAIAYWLGDKPFMHGAKASAVDASVGAFVAGIVDDGFDTPLRQAARARQNLVAYGARIKDAYYPEFR